MRPGGETRERLNTLEMARERRHAANLGQGNSDAKKTDIKEKTSDSAQEESQKKTGEIEDRTREMSPT